MERIKLSLIFFLIINSIGFAQWSQLGNANGGFGSTYEIVSIESTLFVSAGNGGIFKSTDNGISWALKNTGLPVNQGVQNLVAHGSLLYASISRDGVYLSSDEGETWTPINSGISSLTFYNIGVENSNIYGGNANGGIYFSNDNGANWVEKSNNVSNQQIQDFAFFKSQVYASGKSLFTSSNDGDTWNEVVVNGQTANGFRSMVTTGDKLFLGGDGNIFSSTDGINWTNHNLNLGSTILSMKASLDKVYFTTGVGKLYVSEDNGLNWTLLQNNETTGSANDAIILRDNIIMSTSQGLYISNNNGQTWSETTNEITPLEVISLAVLDHNIYAGTSYQGVFRFDSNNGTWSRINSGLDGQNAYNIEDIIIVEDQLFLGTGGGVYTSTDFGNTWSRLFNPGINKSTQAMDFNNGIFVSATNGTGVYFSNDLAKTWTLADNIGLNTDTSYWSIQIRGSTIITSTHDGEIFISENLGESWSNISIPLGYTPAFDLILTDQKLYAGTNKGIYVSEDKGQNWVLLGNNKKTTRSIIKNNDKIYSASSYGIFETDEINNTYKDISDQVGNQATSKIILSNEKLYVGTFSSSIWQRLISDFDENLSFNFVENKNEGLKTYPNPVKNELKIVVDDLADLSQINIFNSDGKLILSKKIANIGIYHLDLTTLSRGLYFIQIKNKFSKLIKE